MVCVGQCRHQVDRCSPARPPGDPGRWAPRLQWSQRAAGVQGQQGPPLRWVGGWVGQGEAVVVVVE